VVITGHHFNWTLLERALQRVARHTRDHTAAGPLFCFRRCIQSLAWTSLRAFALVLP
jgi:hypothetical protein